MGLKYRDPITGEYVRYNFPLIKVGQSEINQLTDKVSALESKLTITPDHFTGTDTEKMQQAINHVVTSQETMTIQLNRAYDITGGVIKMPSSAYWGYMQIVGGEIIKNDPGYIFDRDASNMNCNSPKLVGVRVTTNTTNVYLYNGDKMIRQFCDNVVFTKVGLVRTTEYLQTVRLHNCEIGQLGCDFVVADNCFDCEFMHNRFESSVDYHAIKIQTVGTGISYFGLRITSNLLEGYVYTTPIVVGVGYGLDISNNYFEANKVSIRLDNLGKSSTLVTGRIANNVFGATKGDYDVEIVGTVNVSKLFVDYNTSNIPSNKFMFSKNLSKGSMLETNTAYSGGKIYKMSTTYKSTQDASFPITCSETSGGLKVEISLPLNASSGLWSTPHKQLLVNISSTFGSSVWYSGHLTGILSIDGYYDTTVSSLVCGLNFTTLSTRNTSGMNNGNLSNASSFDYYFKESGNKTINPDASKVTIVFLLPKMKYNELNTHCSVKSLNALQQDYLANI